MIVAIRKSLRDFIAVLALVVIASAVSYYILQEQRLRIPVLEEKPFELKAEFETAQGVVAGQGQTIRVAGVRVGDVAQVELVDGRAVVTFAIDREYLPIYRDSTMLLRPQTGLKDMFFQLDPGTRAAGEFDEGDTLPVANTAPDVNLDEILAALDGDSQSYLRTLVVGLGRGLEGRDRDLGKVLAALGPINRDLDQLSTEVAKRDDNLARLIHNLNILTKGVGQQDEDIATLISASNSTLGAIAEQDPDVQRATDVLPDALGATRDALSVADEFGNELGGSLEALRPFARNLTDMNIALRSLGERTTPVLANQIRPLVRAARPVVPDLRRAANRFSKAAPKLTRVGKKLNELGNMAGYNPRGAEEPGVAGRDEGYLYWGAWLGHNGTSTFASQDGNGLYRRLYFTASCSNLASLLAGGPAGPLVTAIVTGLGPVFEDEGACG